MNLMILAWIGYFVVVLGGRLLLSPPLFRYLFLFANLGAYYLSFMHDHLGRDILISAGVVTLGMILSYFVLQFVVAKKRYYYVAILSPFISFAFFRSSDSFFLLGQSFLAIRLSYLAFEALYREQPLPAFIEYVNFAFFLPTSVMGPITPYSNFNEDLQRKYVFRFDWNSLYRLLFGFVKVFALSSILFTLSFENFEDDLKYHFFEFILAGIFFYFALYLKLSGICDIVITFSYFLGFEVRENFLQPLKSRNIQDHWRRWHVSLLNYFREVFFLPLSISLQRKFGQKNNGVIVIGLTFFIFTLISIWHGPKWEYLAFAWLHAFGVSWILMYEKFLKFLLKDKYSEYKNSRWAYLGAWSITLVYIGFSYIIYENPRSFWN